MRHKRIGSSLIISLKSQETTALSSVCMKLFYKKLGVDLPTFLSRLQRKRNNPRGSIVNFENNCARISTAQHDLI